MWPPDHTDEDGAKLSKCLIHKTSIPLKVNSSLLRLFRLCVTEVWIWTCAKHNQNLYLRLTAYLLLCKESIIISKPWTKTEQNRYFSLTIFLVLCCGSGSKTRPNLWDCAWQRWSWVSLFRLHLSGRYSASECSSIVVLGLLVTCPQKPVDLGKCFPSRGLWTWWKNSSLSLYQHH